MGGEVRLDAFVVMPDHIHGILHIVERVDGDVWQRNYYDQIIWNDDLLKRIRKYIRNNPMKWTLKHDHSIKKDFSHRNRH
jgi:REP element-mobilizing transposase RayT